MLYLKQRRITNGDGVHCFRQTDGRHKMRRYLYRSDLAICRGLCPYLRMYVYHLCVERHRR